MSTLTALLSVSDKTGLVEFAQGLHQLGVRILSTGGTARLLTEAGIPATEVSDVTQFPEILDGRVKTLHPSIHGGILAKRDDATHQQTLKDHDIQPIDLVVVNLYPFQQTVAATDCTLAHAIENIDIGGPAMVRAAAKNHGNDQGGVTVVVDPADYPEVLEALQHHNQTSYALRLRLATKAYGHTAAYDGAISNYLSALAEPAPAPAEVPERQQWPHTLTLQMQRSQSLRYGENPHQEASFYRDLQPAAAGLLGRYEQLQGKELSYNNIADADAAWECVRSLTQPACVIVKHANPCGVALGANSTEAYQRAFQTDSTSAFGGIIAFNSPVDASTVEALNQQFVEVLLAPEYSPEALQMLAQKKNMRVLRLPLGDGHNDFELKRVGGGWLAQTPDTHADNQALFEVVTQRQPTPEQMNDLLFAWTVAKFVKSNAIVFCRDNMTVGIGAGQMSRVDSARIAALKADNAGLGLQRSAVASDAFFPFRDGLDVVAEAGATAVIQPGGSIRDDEVIAAANERDIVMVFTKTRHFRH
ncbi:MAG TPA: bifunctional phosphoribosylaminoimidazolecarboxamide formyltransferase/IMP cyclohydrolase [Paenalcaligenes sp.]|nr:bifunctional phosphoribosylaminoimidazolecarboxamide formyltransferase/IMP cyclohydrolase [Paenalcaligenes sp.]